MTDDANHHAMRRQPLLSPVVITGLVLAIAVVVAAWLAFGFLHTPGMVIVTRHVEKTAEPVDNPGPSPQGELRARALAMMFNGTGIDAVFATEYLRSFATAAPLANRLSLPVHVYDARDSEGLAGRINDAYRYDTVFVVGHSNTVPAIVHAISGHEVPDIDESRYGDLYLIIRPRWGRTTVIHLYLPAPPVPE